MAVPRNLDARRYYRVALQRLDDGRLILDELQRPNAAIYLGGYAAECMLKAVLLESTSSQDLKAVQAELIGSRGHDLEWLRAKLAQRSIRMSMEMNQRFVYVQTWSINMRYDPAPGSHRDAEQFMEALEAVVGWAKERI